jgi:ATP-dependent exoDNAse (exonuclease V) beta subunit
MNVFGNCAISASAGTGKTWALAHRYLALLAAGVPPDRICALTFSRKAAGEIFDAIVARLCLSAGDGRERDRTAGGIVRQMPGISPPAQGHDYVALLRALLNQSHRLRIGTLDSFILGVARSFPLELGLPTDLRPMDNDGGEAHALRHALLTRLYDPQQRERDGAGDRSGAALLDACRQAAFGKEGKGLARLLEGAIGNSHDFYRQHGSKAWGDADRIWPNARWWEAFPEDARTQAAAPAYLERLRQAFGGETRARQLGDACAGIAAAAAAHAPDRPWPEALSDTVLRSILAGIGNPAVVPTLLYYKKSHALPPDLWPPLRAALANLVGVELRRSQQKTAGLRALLERYDALYREAQRHDGRLSFTDFALRLGEPANQPSLHADSDRLYIDYRLDSQLDHWLLDEFQDTSDIQWRAIANLADEVVQDSEQRRSFFYVGDIKQSIYGWRGGNYRLFGRVSADFHIPRGDPLVECHRSLPAIIDTLNTVFDGLGEWSPRAGRDRGPHPSAIKAFLKEWQPHVSARRGEGDGFTALLEYTPKAPGARAAPDTGGDGAADDGDGDPAQYEAIAAVLADVQPVLRGLSAAVLVRGNQQGRACADVLRRALAGVPVVHEGTGGILDNPVVTLLLALVRYAAHPADTLAMRHLQMSPLAEAAGDAGWLTGLSGRLLAQVQETGFAGALRGWGDRLTDVRALRSDDAFGRQRLRELLAAAEAFDATGSRDPDAFCDHIRAHQVKSESAAGAIRVMTIHQSKGLGFDLVLVPFDPRARGFCDTAGIGLLRSDCGRDAFDENGWVLQPPKRLALEAAGGAPVAALEAARAEENFAQLCVLYVALTRARRAMYLFVPPASEKSATVREADLLRERLAVGPAGEAPLHGLTVLHTAGSRAWDAEIPAVTPGGAAGQAGARAPRPLAVTFVAEAARREPSKERAEGRPFPARHVFDREASDVRAFGSAIHRLFERIAWIEDADLEAVIAGWRAESPESEALLRDVETQFRNCLASPEVRAVLARPAGAAQADVWRETPFDTVREGPDGREIVTGRFDRLVIARDRSHQPLSAWVVDFKSNRVADDREMAAAATGYQTQMQEYAAAAARLLGLPAGAVTARLLFTRIGKVYG